MNWWKIFYQGKSALMNCAAVFKHVPPPPTRTQVMLATADTLVFPVLGFPVKFSDPDCSHGNPESHELDAIHMSWRWFWHRIPLHHTLPPFTEPFLLFLALSTVDLLSGYLPPTHTIWHPLVILVCLSGKLTKGITERIVRIVPIVLVSLEY